MPRRRKVANKSTHEALGFVVECPLVKVVLEELFDSRLGLVAAIVLVKLEDICPSDMLVECIRLLQRALVEHILPLARAEVH